MMKKWLVVCMCMVLLLSLTACGGRRACDPLPLPEDADYRYGTEQLELGNLAKAYGYFKDSADPRAAEMLEHFVFVPTKSAVQRSYDGQNTVTTYTYDAKGNLLEKKETGKSNWTTEADLCLSYIYDKDNRVLIHSYRNETVRFVESYAYDDDNDAIISYTYTPIYDDGPTRSSGYIRTFDQRGNVVKEEHFDIYDEAYNYILTYTYDEQDRILTRTHTDYDDEADVWTYVYDEEGNYHCVHKGDEYTQTTHYNKDGKLVKTEIVHNETGEVRELYEYRYDEKGNEIYRRTRYLDNETVHTTTYNERGLILSSESSRDGEVYAMSAYTYDQNGNKLTYEHFSGSTIWGRETLSYDEQGHLLTWKKMDQNSWSNTTYTYDEAGNRIKGECKSNEGTTTEEYTYDEWGNLLTFRSYRISNGWETATVASIEWQVQYYPDGIPEQVQDAIDNAMSE